MSFTAGFAGEGGASDRGALFFSLYNRDMDHVAIMRKSWGLTEKILTGEKKIESRWYLSRCRPWDSIKRGDAVYFKNSGEPVKVRAQVWRVMQFADLTSRKVKTILNRYGRDDGISKKDIKSFYEKFKNKRYCVLIFIKNPRKIRSFEINKKGFGAMAAWITVDDIRRVM